MKGRPYGGAPPRGGDLGIAEKKVRVSSVVLRGNGCSGAGARRGEGSSAHAPAERRAAAAGWVVAGEVARRRLLLPLLLLLLLLARL